jgi:hypothetical protein
MRLSRGKINHISKLLLQVLEESPQVDFIREPNDVRLQMVRVITDELTIEEVVDEEVRRTLASYSRKLREGTPEWEILYNKHYEEEMMRRRGF